MRTRFSRNSSPGGGRSHLHHPQDREWSQGKRQGGNEGFGGVDGVNDSRTRLWRQALEQPLGWIGGRGWDGKVGRNNPFLQFCYSDAQDLLHIYLGRMSADHAFLGTTTFDIGNLTEATGKRDQIIIV